MASVNFCGRAVPLYFSMRAYPKRKGQYNQKKLESSFIRALRHLLPKKYTYTIVSDRGFGNDRFAQLCADKGFDFVLRLNENLNIRIGDKVYKLSDFNGKNTKFTAYVFRWEKEAHFEIHTENSSTWFLMLSKLEISGKETYQKRFQDQKSAGLNIEKCKIRKYDRFKRLYFATCLSQLLIVTIGEYIENKQHPIKKRFPIIVNVTPAFLSSDGIFAKNYFTG